MLSIFDNIWAFLSGEKIFPAFISAITTIIVFFLTLFTKRYADTRILSSKLETEHRFDQQKKIKETLARYKVQLLTACEDLHHRLSNLSKNYGRNWMHVEGNYQEEHYYFHSTAYRILCVFAWIRKINREMIFLDTTIATDRDLDFIKFLKAFPNLFCDITHLVGSDARGEYAVDHFFKINFESLPDAILTNNEVDPYANYKKNLPVLYQPLHELYHFLDGIDPHEDRLRWERLHFVHLALVAFLNSYGYDFQYTPREAIKEILATPKPAANLPRFFNFMEAYHLHRNRQVRKLYKLSEKYFYSGRDEIRTD